VVRRIDVNHIAQEIDMDEMLERIDINALLDRVDFDRHLQRVNVDDIIRRSNLEEIVARSTSGVFTHVLDAARTQIMLLDESIHRVARCSPCRNETKMLPPTPLAGVPSEHDTPYPQKTTIRAVANQGRCAGILSRCLARLIDWLVISLIFAIALLIIDSLGQVLIGDDNWQLPQEHWAIDIAAYLVWSICYHAISLAMVGQTVGKAILGILVVQTNGSPVPLGKATLRSALFYISAVSIIGVLMGLFRRDRRQLHGIGSCTCVIYDWDGSIGRRIRKKAWDGSERFSLPLLIEPTTTTTAAATMKAR
jgi:uncharacterized RDD family membrane protein YckC